MTTQTESKADYLYQLRHSAAHVLAQAVKELFPETKLTIGKLRGQVHRYYGVPLIVTYHPAALLRNPAWKRPTWEDVQLAHRILTGAADPKSGA